MSICLECGGFNGDNYCYRTKRNRLPGDKACGEFTRIPEHLMVERLEDAE